MADEEQDNIWIAVSNGDIDRVKHLVSKEGVSVNSQDEMGYSPMHAAASYGEVEILEYLHSKGAMVDIRDNDGDTPLLVVETPAVFEILVQLGADTNARNSDNQGLLEKVIEDENEDLFEYLVQRGFVTDTDLIAKVRARLSGQGGGEEEHYTATMEDLLAMSEQQDDDEENMNT